MTTVTIDLPDELARDAQRAGLLRDEVIARSLRQQLQTRRTDELFAAADRMAAINEPAVMSPEQIAEAMRLMGAERCPQSAR